VILVERANAVKRKAASPRVATRGLDPVKYVSWGQPADRGNAAPVFPRTRS